MIITNDSAHANHILPKDDPPPYYGSVPGRNQHHYVKLPDPPLERGSVPTGHVVVASHAIVPQPMAINTMYIGSSNAQHLISPLPPDHPAFICSQTGEHVPASSYSLIGLMSAVVCFPWGIGLCILDRRVTCARCGGIIKGGLCE